MHVILLTKKIRLFIPHIQKNNNFHQNQKAYMELRYYEYKEIVTLLESVGFKIKEKYGWYDKCSLEKGHEIIIVAEK